MVDDGGECDTRGGELTDGERLVLRRLSFERSDKRSEQRPRDCFRAPRFDRLLPAVSRIGVLGPALPDQLSRLKEQRQSSRVVAAVRVPALRGPSSWSFVRGGGELAGDTDLLNDRQLAGDSDDPLSRRRDGRRFVAGDVEEAARVLPDRFVLVEAEPDDLGAVSVGAFADERDRPKHCELVGGGLDRFILCPCGDLGVADRFLLRVRGHEIADPKRRRRLSMVECRCIGRAPVSQRDCREGDLAHTAERVSGCQ